MSSEGVKTLRGEPEKAVVKISVPIMVTFFVQALYNLADGVWVAGLGADALAGIGLFFPLFAIIIGLSSGLGAGTNSAISRRIGAGKNPNVVAEHSIALSILTGVLVITLLLPSIEPILRLIGAYGKSLEYAIEYATILILGSPMLIFNIAMSNGVFTGSGDSKRPMYATTSGSFLNIILDPIFIYVLNLGVAGAAYATVVSFAVTATILFRWLFIVKKTIFEFDFRRFRFDFKIVKDILRVGIPSSFIQISMSVSGFVLNAIILLVNGSEGIAVFTSAFRVFMFAMIPIMGMGIATVAVVGASYGARDSEKLRRAYFYPIKTLFMIGIATSTAIIVLAPHIAFLFTYNSPSIEGELIKCLRFMALSLPFIPLGFVTSSMFQGIGKGERAFALNFLRTIIFQISFAYVFSVTLNFGLTGVWLGFSAGNISASFIGLTWGYMSIKSISESFRLLKVEKVGEV